MSMLKICGQELELDLFDADVMEVYEKSMDKVVKRAEETKKHTKMSNADGIREMCGIVKDFFDEVFGEGTADKLFKDKSNLAICMDAFGIVSSEAGKMKGQVNAITNKYNMNRAQRRQEGKKNKHGKNGAVVTPIGNASGRDNS
jgi:hypothetical protein